MRKALSFLAIVGAALALPLAAQSLRPLSPTAAQPMSPAEAVQGNAPTAPGQVLGAPLTAADVNAWLDGFMPYALARGDIPGAVVVVVRDGQVLAQRGYGYADLATRKRIDPRTTLFRPGSISKLFTWTAVMQQVEQGKLNLDADVNQYLDFKIPPYRGKPVTLRNIMTHTAGFEEQVKDIITTGDNEALPYEQLLKRWVPSRVYAPGITPAYSNYATSLAGYIVQRVSGEPFNQYIERHIFAPLGMTRSSMRQPLPAHLKPLMANGYSSGADEPVGFEFVGPAPAGSLSASGEDMGRFMIAHLQNGRGILQPQTARLMHSRASHPIPGLNGMTLGFYEHNINGRRVIAHGGDTNAFHSDLHLFPAEGTGLYLSFNSGGKEGTSTSLRQAIFEQFADRYFPAGPAAQPTVDAETARRNAELLVGTWSSSRRAFSSFVSIADLLGQTRISVGEDGQLIAPVAEVLGLRPFKWVPAGPMLWRDANGHEMLGAKVENGKAVQLSINAIAPIMVMLPVPWYLNSAWLLPLLYASMAILALTLILWPTRALVRRRFGAALPLEPRDLRAYRWSRVAAAAILGVLVAWFTAVTMMFADVSFGSAMDAIILTLGVLSLVAFVGGFLVLLWYAYTVWRGKWRWTAKAWSVLLVIASATVLHVAINYNLIGFSTNY
ncbi:MAG TPA: serine hydrolase [Allosphingosinicella sp.]|jgi:CubicO group peptidase (beta-lactamase class C family)